MPLHWTPAFLWTRLCPSPSGVPATSTNRDTVHLKTMLFRIEKSNSVLAKAASPGLFCPFPSGYSAQSWEQRWICEIPALQQGTRLSQHQPGFPAGAVNKAFIHQNGDRLVRLEVRRVVLELAWDAALNRDGLGREGGRCWEGWLSGVSTPFVPVQTGYLSSLQVCTPQSGTLPRKSSVPQTPPSTDWGPSSTN